MERWLSPSVSYVPLLFMTLSALVPLSLLALGILVQIGRRTPLSFLLLLHAVILFNSLFLAGFGFVYCWWYFWGRGTARRQLGKVVEDATDT